MQTILEMGKGSKPGGEPDRRRINQAG